jgi:hypothetical protein
MRRPLLGTATLVRHTGGAKANSVLIVAISNMPPLPFELPTED